ncbi:hypothetical protein VNO80_16832 [Phaseolus coccineus]|uniref:Cysteine-rich receptor-like protein kinase 25 n=1 Tax=Phaseolus coccineus TaxID=3886 RepID=A0AAN9R8D1_PHACN
MFWRNMFLSSSNNHVTFLLFLSLFGIEPFFSSGAPVYNYCPSNASYNSSVTFETNLKILLESLVSNISQSDGSYSSAMGLGTTSVASGYFLCRGDVSLTMCNDCITTAVTEITQLCPNKTESIIWYDECTLRFTNRYFSPTATEPGASLSNNKNISALDLDSFNHTLFGLLDDLLEETANSNSARKFATGDREFAGTSSQRTVYALTECEPTLTKPECEECLQNAISTLPSCCEGKQGARALLAWCNVRYDWFQFYNASATSAPSSGNNSNVVRVLVIVALVIVSIILLCGVCYFIFKRSRKKYNTLLRENFGEESSTLESLQFDLATMEVATKKFSHENRIGEGGFGDVYKGILPDGREIAVKKLSHSSGQDQYEGKTNRIVGTYGYMSPEYAMYGNFSEKSDVFSFGVIVLEILSAKKNSRHVFSDHDNLLSYAWDQWRDQTPLNILDENIKESCNDSEVVKCIQIGLLCVQEKPQDRPTMTQVVSYLSGSLSELPFPEKPINCNQSGIVQRMLVGGSSSGSALSKNEMSVTIFAATAPTKPSSVRHPQTSPPASSSAATCKNCVATAASEITRRCHNQTESIIWYDQCMVAYTNDWFDPLGVDPKVNLWDNKSVSTSDFENFNRTLFGLLNGLAEDAVSSESTKKFATGEAEDRVGSWRRVYGMVQCVPSATNDQCETCLKHGIGTLFSACCEGKQGARALLAWCNIRYELYQFYNTTLTPSTPLVPSPAPSVGDERDKMELLQFNFLTVEAATNKFSSENKIGKGGFGEVYKIASRQHDQATCHSKQQVQHYTKQEVKSHPTTPPRPVEDTRRAFLRKVDHMYPTNVES